jgi:hypothetical protein
MLVDLRVRTRISDTELQAKLGRVLTPADYNVLLTGPTKLLTPAGQPLCVYLPGAVAAHATSPDIYGVLHGLRSQRTDNRGAASGSPRHQVEAGGRRTRAAKVPSSIIGAVDPMGVTKYCRLTAWTGKHLPEFETLRPLLHTVAGQLRRHVPDRYAAQAARTADTHPAWVIPGTPFTTLTVNNTYPTGTHCDKGDLDEGFSTIACLRRGTFTGGQLVFPLYRVAVDLQDGDLLLMDAHQYHGNVAIRCACGTSLNGACDTCGAERISVVAYYRTRMAGCGSPDEEFERAVAQRDRSRR